MLTRLLTSPELYAMLACWALAAVMLAHHFRTVPMRMGTRSLLFGVHQFALHPLLLFVSWWRLYGFPCDPRLYVAFIVHDWGYFGRRKMDDADGERHVELGAAIMHALFDWTRAEYFRLTPDSDPRKALAEANRVKAWLQNNDGDLLLITRFAAHVRRWVRPTYWRDFTHYHSRFMAKRDGVSFSRLCVADKFVIATEPWWLYLPRAILSGEIEEYMRQAEAGGKCDDMATEAVAGETRWQRRRNWYATVQAYCYEWVMEHRDGGEDTWTRVSSVEGVAAKD